MIPAGNFNGAPGAGLGNVRTLYMPQSSAAWPTPFNASKELNPAAMVPQTGARTVSLAGLRGASAADSPLYAAVTLAGAGLGGALLGWVAADSRDGAMKGGAFAAGMTGFSTGLATWGAQKMLGATLVVAGLGGMLWAVKSKIKRR